jgi:site-specific recombinase XerD
MTLPPDPSFRDLQLLWEKQYWYKARGTWQIQADAYENWQTFFGPDRKPRDVFRNDVKEYEEWLRKKGWSNNHIHSQFERARRFYRFLNELELVEKDWNPFENIGPRRIRT